MGHRFNILPRRKNPLFLLDYEYLLNVDTISHQEVK